MNKGKILKTDETKKLFADPGSRAGAELTGCKNIAKARKIGEYEVEVPDWGHLPAYRKAGKRGRVRGGPPGSLF